MSESSRPRGLQPIRLLRPWDFPSKSTGVGCHYLLREEDITIVNIYAPNIGAPQCITQTLADIKGEIDSNTIIVGDFNTPLTPIDRSSKHKINKEKQVLNDTLDEMDLTDIVRTFHINAKEYTFFSSVHRIFSRIGHILGHK